MNAQPALPAFSAWLVASATTGSADIPITWIDIAARYGLPTLLLLALGWFTFWQEKQRNKREAEARAERERQLNSLITELHQRNKVIDEQMQWMREKIE